MLSFFYGWYMKCQSDTQTLAVIPAVHRSGRTRTCSIQLITDDSAWTVTFPGEVFHRSRSTITIGKNRFSEKGVRLAIRTPELNVKGRLKFGPLTPLKYDIMGPFALVPFLECRHSVWSMRHAVNGTVIVNGQTFTFQNACGYWEGDRGRSFPKEYLWTQCSFQNGSVMLSVADIPVFGIHFTGIIGVIWWQGKEYRLATYLGARIVEHCDRKVHIRQRDLELEVRLLSETDKPLRAPRQGEMVRTIRENAACRAFYGLKKGGRTLFSAESERASFEYEYEGNDYNGYACRYK